MKLLDFAVATAMLFTAASPAFAVGAIAVDDSAGSKPSDAGYGIGFGDDRKSAERAALSKCEGAGNEGCRVKVWFETCGAYAASNDHYGIGWGSTAGAAKDAAIEQCGNDSCRLVASDCGD